MSTNDFSQHYGNPKLILSWICIVLKWEIKQPSRYIFHYSLWISPFLDHDIKSQMWDFLFNDPIYSSVIFFAITFTSGLFFYQRFTKRHQNTIKNRIVFVLYLTAHLTLVAFLEDISIQFEAKVLGVEVNGWATDKSYDTIVFLGTVFFFFFIPIHEIITEYRKEMKRWICPPRPGISHTFNYESMNTHSLSVKQSRPKSQTGITIVLTALIVMVPFLTFFTFYDISNMDENTFQNSNFNKELWDKTDFTSILLGLLAASAAIVAVAFTVTQLLIENVAQKYTSKIHEFLLEYVNPNRPFFILLVVIGISASLVLFMDLLEPPIFLIVISLVVDIFLVGLLLFTQNYYDLFRVINPLSLIDLMGDKVIKNLEGISNENKEE